MSQTSFNFALWKAVSEGDCATFQTLLYSGQGDKNFCFNGDSLLLLATDRLLSARLKAARGEPDREATYRIIFETLLASGANVNVANSKG